MRVFTYKRLREFWERHADSKAALLSWYTEAVDADWDRPTAVTARYPSASILRGNRVVFNIRGNRYRLITHINYDYGVVYIRFVGTHAEYDRINAEEV